MNWKGLFGLPPDLPTIDGRTAIEQRVDRSVFAGVQPVVYAKQFHASEFFAMVHWLSGRFVNNSITWDGENMRIEAVDGFWLVKPGDWVCVGGLSGLGVYCPAVFEKDFQAVGGVCGTSANVSDYVLAVDKLESPEQTGPVPDNVSPTPPAR